VNPFLLIERDILEHLADAVNPLLVVLLIGSIVWRARHDKEFRAGEFFARAVAALVLAFVVGRINGELHLWPGLPSDPAKFRYEFPSGHTCFAVSIATSLYRIHARWLLFVVPLLLFYGALIALPPLRYHAWIDVVGAWFLIPPLTLLAHKTTPLRRNKMEEKI
jgi:membrane-associated phospholipid phosphatase